MAAMSGEEQIIKYLHQAGASSAVRDNLERTPLHVATESSNQKAVDFLTEKFKASVHERTKVSLSLDHSLMCIELNNLNTKHTFYDRKNPCHTNDCVGLTHNHDLSNFNSVQVL